MDYLIRFAQSHESFRLAELESLTTQARTILAKQNIQIHIDQPDYRPNSPFCIIRFFIEQVDNDGKLIPRESHEKPWNPTAELQDAIVRDFISRSIQARAIYEIWGATSAPDPIYETLHEMVRRTSQSCWPKYQKNTSFKFNFDCYMGKRSEEEKREIINSFAYLGFEGKVEMKQPDEQWCVMEEWTPEWRALVSPSADVMRDREEQGDDTGTRQSQLEPLNKDTISRPAKLKRIFLGRQVGTSRRWLIDKHDLKKRPYISTTSMDAELALVTANLALASPGKLFLDPFCGTGGFMVAATELGSFVLGHDIDGRSFRGKGRGLEKGVGANFKRYGLEKMFGDCFTADLVSTPLVAGTSRRWLDGIIADPPYGVREGLKVLGSRKLDSPVDGEVSAARQPHLIDGVPAHTLPGFVAPKRPYSFVQLLDDILDFAARTLVDGGRLAFWMPSANESELGEDEVTIIPQHSLLELKHECVQRFNKWSRRLLVYERVSAAEQDDSVGGVQRLAVNGTSADDLNPFRRRYFQAFAEKPKS